MTRHAALTVLVSLIPLVLQLCVLPSAEAAGPWQAQVVSAEAKQPLEGVVTMEMESGGARQWLISAAFQQADGAGHVSALVSKDADNPVVGRAQFQNNLLLGVPSTSFISLFTD